MYMDMYMSTYVCVFPQDSIFFQTINKSKKQQTSRSIFKARLARPWSMVRALVARWAAAASFDFRCISCFNREIPRCMAPSKSSRMMIALVLAMACATSDLWASVSPRGSCCHGPGLNFSQSGESEKKEREREKKEEEEEERQKEMLMKAK